MLKGLKNDVVYLIISLMKKSKFLFDVPVTKDWLFWIFIVLTTFNAIGALSAVSKSGGISTSSGGIISGLIDAAFTLLSAYVFVIPVYWIRKFVRNRNSNE